MNREENIVKLVNIGYGNLISTQRLIAVVSPDSAPIKRMVSEARDRSMLIDATFGRKTRTVLIMDSDHVVLSGLPLEKLAPRLGVEPTELEEEEDAIRERHSSLPAPPASARGPLSKSSLSAGSNLYFSVSATTRAPRPGEMDGVDYHFLSRERFLEWIDRNAFLEYAEFVGNLYGTPKKYVDEAMDSGKDVILDIEVQGAEQVHRQRPDVVRIFIAPPSWEELERRLVGRGTEDPRRSASAWPAAGRRSSWPGTTTIWSSTATWTRRWRRSRPSSPPSTAGPGSAMTRWPAACNARSWTGADGLRRCLCVIYLERKYAIMMLYPAMNKLTANVPNRYLLVNVVARRARQIAEEADEEGYELYEKPVTMAIQEVADGKISVDATDVVIQEEEA